MAALEEIAKEAEKEFTMMYYVANLMSRSIECQDFNTEEEALKYISNQPRSLQHEFCILRSELYAIEVEQKITELQDKLHRRNMQIKDLKAKGIYEGLKLALKILDYYGEATNDAYNSIKAHFENVSK